MSKITPISYIIKRIRQIITYEKTYYELIKRLDNATIVHPFFIVSHDRFSAGKNLLIQRNCYFHCGGLAWSEGRGYIKVGDNCWFSENNILYGAGGIEMGNYSGTGPGVMIFSSRDNYAYEHAMKDHIVHYFKKITIGDYVRIFSGSIISPGVTIGDGAVIGANSLILSDIPPWVIAAGSPAKVIKKRDKDEG